MAITFAITIWAKRSKYIEKTLQNGSINWKLQHFAVAHRANRSKLQHRRDIAKCQKQHMQKKTKFCSGKHRARYFAISGNNDVNTNDELLKMMGKQNFLR